MGCKQLGITELAITCARDWAISHYAVSDYALWVVRDYGIGSYGNRRITGGRVLRLSRVMRNYGIMGEMKITGSRESGK